MPRVSLTSEATDAMRERLVTQTLDIYCREGLDAISFRRLAEAAGISHTLPYRYFADKEALLAAVRAECTRRFERFVLAREDAQAPTLARIRQLAAGYVAFARTCPAEYELIFASHQPPPPEYPELIGARQQLFRHAVRLVTTAIADGVMHGDADTLAHLFWVSLHGLMSLHVSGQLVHGRSLDELLPALVDRMLRHLPAVPLQDPTETRKPS